MSYEKAMEAAGATVHRSEFYGSYDGVWMMHVTHPDGRTGFLIDYYGSCSGCDAYEGTFGWEYEETPEKLAEFAKPYLDELLTKEQALAKCAESDWDEDYAKMAKDIRECEA
jgi:hypothetical protein